MVMSIWLGSMLLSAPPLLGINRFVYEVKTMSSVYRFLDKINQIHSSIKFTMQHTSVYGFTCDECECGCKCEPSESIPFLDTLSTIKDGKIITDLYRKPTDRCQYLLTSSCHPPHVTNNIPYSLALRIVRICSLPEDREKRFSELKDMLIKRDYKSSIVDAAIDKARKIPRPEALKRVTRDRKQDRPVLVVTHDPRLPAVAQIVKKHWRAMTQNPHMKSVYPKPPMIAFKRPRNLKDVCTGEGKGATPTPTEANQSKAWNAQMQFMEMLYLSFCQNTERN